MVAGWIGTTLWLLAEVTQASSLNVPVCPDCAAGCIPEAFVQSLRTEPAPVDWPCPVGCVPLQRVAELRAAPGCIFSLRPDRFPTDNALATRNRTVLMPTARSSPAGQLTMTGYGAGLWQIEYAISEHLQVGSMVTLPIYVAGAIPNFKVQFPFGEHLSLGGGAFFGLGGPYFEDSFGEYYFLVGGHLEASVFLGRHSLTLGMVAGGMGDNVNHADGFAMRSEYLLLPTLGWGWAFSDNWAALVELTAVVIMNGSRLNFEEPTFLLLYGLRGHGEVLFGDLGFALPLVEGYIREVWKYTPLGIPYFSIGLKF